MGTFGADEVRAFAPGLIRPLGTFAGNGQGSYRLGLSNVPLHSAAPQRHSHSFFRRAV